MHNFTMTDEELERLLKKITVNYQAVLPGIKVYHGTIECMADSVKSGPKNIEKGFGGPGLYLTLEKVYTFDRLMPKPLFTPFTVAPGDEINVAREIWLRDRPMERFYHRFLGAKVTPTMVIDVETLNEKGFWQMRGITALHKTGMTQSTRFPQWLSKSMRGLGNSITPALLMTSYCANLYGEYLNNSNDHWVAAATSYFAIEKTIFYPINQYLGGPVSIGLRVADALYGPLERYMENCKQEHLYWLQQSPSCKTDVMLERSENLLMDAGIPYVISLAAHKFLEPIHLGSHLIFNGLQKMADAVFIIDNKAMNNYIASERSKFPIDIDRQEFLDDMQIAINSPIGLAHDFIVGSLKKVPTASNPIEYWEEQHLYWLQHEPGVVRDTMLELCEDHLVDAGVAYAQQQVLAPLRTTAYVVVDAVKTIGNAVIDVVTPKKDPVIKPDSDIQSNNAASLLANSLPSPLSAAPNPVVVNNGVQKVAENKVDVVQDNVAAQQNAPVINQNPDIERTKPSSSLPSFSSSWQPKTQTLDTGSHDTQKIPEPIKNNNGSPSYNTPPSPITELQIRADLPSNNAAQPTATQPELNRLEISNVRIGQLTHGSIGLIGELKMGGNIGAGFKLTDRCIVVFVTAEIPINTAFFASIGELALYALPIVAIAVGGFYIYKSHLKHKAEKTVRHIKRHYNDTQQDLQNYDRILKEDVPQLMQLIENNPKEFQKKIAEFESNLSDMLTKFYHRKQYAQKHKAYDVDNMMAGTLTNVNQSVLALEVHKDNMQLLKRINAEVTEESAGKSIEELMGELKDLSKNENKILTITEYMKIVELKQLIISRCMAAGNYIFILQNNILLQPTAVKCYQLPKIAPLDSKHKNKPGYDPTLVANNIYGEHDGRTRIADKANKQVEKLINAYNEYKSTVEKGDKPDIIAQKKNDFDKCLNDAITILRSIKVKSGGGYITAYDFYHPTIEFMQKSVTAVHNDINNIPTDGKDKSPAYTSPSETDANRDAFKKLVNYINENKDKSASELVILAETLAKGPITKDTLVQLDVLSLLIPNKIISLMVGGNTDEASKLLSDLEKINYVPHAKENKPDNNNSGEQNNRSHDNKSGKKDKSSKKANTTKIDISGIFPNPGNEKYFDPAYIDMMKKENNFAKEHSNENDDFWLDRLKALPQENNEVTAGRSDAENASATFTRQMTIGFIISSASNKTSEGFNAQAAHIYKQLQQIEPKCDLTNIVKELEFAHQGQMLDPVVKALLGVAYREFEFLHPSRTKSIAIGTIDIFNGCA